MDKVTGRSVSIKPVLYLKNVNVSYKEFLDVKYKDFTTLLFAVGVQNY